jgi:hypothetical protein
MTERRTIDIAPDRRSRRVRRLATAAATCLLLATPALAHGGAGRPGGAERFGGAPRPAVAGARAPIAGMLQRLPLGTEVTVALYAADPAEGAEAIATLAAVVGETSEAAFGQELATAAEDAAFAVVQVGPRVRRIDLADAGARAPLGWLGRTGRRLAFGDTIEVALYAGADDAAPTTTVRFTYGEDSEAGFRAQVGDAAADAAAAEVTLPAQERTIDLSARPFAGAREGVGPGPRTPPRRVR